MTNPFTQKLYGKQKQSNIYDFALVLFNKAITGSYPSSDLNNGFIVQDIIDIFGPDNEIVTKHLNHTTFYMEVFNGKEYWLGVDSALENVGVSAEYNIGAEFEELGKFIYIIPSCNLTTEEGTIQTVKVMDKYLQDILYDHCNDNGLRYHLIANYLYRAFAINVFIPDNYDKVFESFPNKNYTETLKDFLINKDSKYCETISNNDIRLTRLVGCSSRYHINHSSINAILGIEEDLDQNIYDLLKEVIDTITLNYSCVYDTHMAEESKKLLDLIQSNVKIDSNNSSIKRVSCYLMTYLTLFIDGGMIYNKNTYMHYVCTDKIFESIKTIIDKLTEYISEAKNIFYVNVLMRYTLDTEEYMYASRIINNILFYPKKAVYEFKDIIISFIDLIVYRCDMYGLDQYGDDDTNVYEHEILEKHSSDAVKYLKDIKDVVIEMSKSFEESDK